MMRHLPLAEETWVHRRQADESGVPKIVQCGPLGSMIRWAAQQPGQEQQRYTFSIRTVEGFRSWHEIQAAAHAAQLI